MNKSELVDAMVSDRPMPYGQASCKAAALPTPTAIASKASISKKTADATLTTVLEAIVEAVAAGDKVTLVGFGSFESCQRQARKGRNPKTGNKMQIPATKVPAFSAGKQFREKVSSSKKKKKSKSK